MFNLKAIGIVTLMATAAATAACAPTRTQQSGGEYFDDSVLTSKVKAELVDDPVTKARNISVETYRGVVSLSGFVDNPGEKAAAIKIARSVKGVKEVRDNLELKK